jgi:hypothetical protein
MGKNGSAAWAGFLAAAFLVIGLVGAMGIFAAQVPFERALARDAALQQVLEAQGLPDTAERMATLRPALGDSADHVLFGPGDIRTRVATERSRMLAAFGHEAQGEGFRLRIVLAVFTIAGAVFGIAILAVVQRAQSIKG